MRAQRQGAIVDERKTNSNPPDPYSYRVFGQVVVERHHDAAHFRNRDHVPNDVVLSEQVGGRVEGSVVVRKHP